LNKKQLVKRLTPNHLALFRHKYNFKSLRHHFEKQQTLEKLNYFPMNDAAIQFPVVCFGEILWDILPTGTLPGGAPLHLAYHLNKLGIPPAVITKAGLDASGKKLVELLETWNISTDFFQLDNNLPTGRVQAIIDEDNDISYDVRKPAAWDHITWDNAFTELLTQSRFFVFGSLAARTGRSRQTLYDLLEIAPYKILDLNLRPPHYSRQVIQHILGKADILKLNMAELELITGWFTAYPSFTDRVKLLQDEFLIKNIILTKGKEGSFINFDGHLSSHSGFNIQTADSKGSGDAFLAGLLYKLIHAAPVSEAHLFASAMGSLVASIPGGFPGYTIDDINDINSDNNNASLHTHI
jgi:fructokinase